VKVTRPLIVSDSSTTTTILGLHGGNGAARWRCFTPGIVMQGPWETFETLRLSPGAQVGLHSHPASEEIAFVASGEGLFQHGADSFDVVPGDLIAVHPAVEHGVTNTGTDDLVVVVVRLSLTDTVHSANDHEAKQTAAVRVNLLLSGSIAVRENLSDRWRNAEVVRLGAGASTTLEAHDGEYGIFGISGSTQVVDSDGKSWVIGPGNALVIPLNGFATIETTTSQFTFFVVTTRVLSAS
jgi:quercetin dioxygenase-like cupin family protein